uniref:GED domain-containing protein n=1 Tax=Nelumbo nucifera TaxID=4432 RepID=A0A822XQQ8_NELNU|nr:TPA_asm: hypothetical protein HUJ06_025407 [Nelumbo nucifera]
MANMLDECSKELQQKCMQNTEAGSFLMHEIKVLEEARGIELPNFLSHTAFLIILQRRLKQVSNIPVELAEKFWDYTRDVVVRVLMLHCENYPQLQSSTRRAAQNVIAKMKEQSIDRVREMLEMEKLTDYTCNPEYMKTWSALMTQQEAFTQQLTADWKPDSTTIDGYGEVELGHLREIEYPMLVERAFDLRMRITAYWKVVLQRLVDCLALHLLFNVQNLVNKKELEKEVLNELMMGPHSGGIERLLEESPTVAHNRECLNKSIILLQECKNSWILDMFGLTKNKREILKIAFGN